MVSLRSLATAVIASAALLIPTSLAHSLQRGPLSYVSLIDDVQIKTPSHRIHSNSQFDLIFTLHDGQQKIRLQLEPNRDILHDTFAITHLGPDGKVSRVETVDRGEDKVFKGKSYVQREGSDGWSSAGWARITIHRDGEHPVFEGSFRLDGDQHHIQTGALYERLKHGDDPEIEFGENPGEMMIVWRDSDIMTWPGFQTQSKRDLGSMAVCDADTLGFNRRFHEARGLGDMSSMNPRSLFGRQSIDGGSSGGSGSSTNLIDTIGSVAGCPTTRKVALVGIATDCTYTAAFNSSESVRKNIISFVNSASQVYESSFNISLGIQNLTISNETCPGTAPSTAEWNTPCSDSVTLTDRLNLFSKWRGQFDDTNAYWTLLSTCNTDAAVGLSWLGQLCRSGSTSGSDSSGSNETIASANVVVQTSTEWQVFAHETGHMFGAVHDCTSSACPQSSSTQTCCPLSASTCSANGKYIMNPSAAEGISNFSPCTIGEICSNLQGAVNATCLSNNKNVETITGSQCGNGIVESGEECDCGGTSGCGDNSCCDATTCKFKTGAVCDPTNEDCCTSSCQFASSGTVCRASTGDCDPAETCTGSSPSCPADVHAKDGTSCGSNGLKCASGECTSRDLQCQNMIGNLTSANDTTACDSSGCLLSCKSPDFGYNTCANLNQNFLDGTPCAGGGHCENGSCKGSSTGKEILDWLKSHKTIAIPVGCVIAALLLLAICSCLYSSIQRYKARRRAPKPTEMSVWPAGGPGMYSSGANPNMPPPAYSPYGAPNVPGQGQWPRGRSVRYA